MSNNSRINELVARASTLRKQRCWREARECYEQMISLGLTPLDEAKMLANILQMYEKEGNVDEAIASGERALGIVETYSLHRTNEGVHLHGFVTGRLRRLRGEGFPWRLPATLLSAYFVGASLGAVIGEQIVYKGLTIRGFVLADLRYGGAGIGALLGWLLLTRPLFLISTPLQAMAGVLNFAVLCYVLIEKDFWLGLAVLGVLFIPIGLGLVIAFLRED